MTGHLANAEPLRSALVRGTQKIHNALYHEPVFACLLDPELNEQQYTRALRVFAKFYAVIEHTRASASLCPELSLASECEALHHDL